jgi:cobalt-zinc-cadmium efflux system outer membrane protein
VGGRLFCRGLSHGRNAENQENPEPGEGRKMLGIVDKFVEASGGRRSGSPPVFAICALLLLGIPTPSWAQESYSLDQLLVMGRERNHGLLAMQAERDAMEADRRDAGRFQNPELEFATGEGDLFDEPESKSVREFSISQNIGNPLVRHYTMGARRDAVEAATEGVRYGSLEVDYEVRYHFFRILYLQELLDLARLDEEALEEVTGLIETRARVGEVRELEAIRLRVEHMRAQNRVNAAELELTQFRRHLNVFLGNSLPEGFRLSGELDADLQIPDLVRLRDELLPEHPLLLQATEFTEGAGRALKASQFRWIPDPVVSATKAKELDGDILTFGIGFEIPLWNQSRAAAEREKQTLRQMEQQEAGLRMELEAELMTHHNDLLLHRQTLQLFQEGLLREADASMDIAETSYREGEISLVEYLETRRTFQSIQIEFQQALFDWNQGLAELNRAVGGGIL